MNAIQERLRNLDEKEFIKQIDDFHFDEAHGFIDDEYGDNEADIYSIEIMALYESVKTEPTQADRLLKMCTRAYKMGYMRASGLI